MNDRLTFRIWSKERQKYEHPSYVEETSLLVLARLSEKKYTVEQCTGLKDKNGNFIYEGDIVKEKLFNKEIAVIKFGNGYGYQCFYPDWKGKYSKETKYNPGFRKDLYYWLNKQEGLGVIGNIHENPELLEDK